MTQTILLVDDEPDILELLCMTVDRMSLTPVRADDVMTAISKLKNQNIDLCLTDLRLPDGTGIEIVDYIQQNLPDLPVAVISAHGNMGTAIDAMKSGAFDFISKPIDLTKLRTLIESALALNDGHKPETYSKQTPRLLGHSPGIESIRNQIGKLSRSMAPVHIRGESGTGKELVARLIHDCSSRNKSPFIAVNCSAIPAELMESEFFGHRKGSFTGATRDNPGLFAAADGGTLFLDEIADLPLPMQAKLLRAIQERAIRPVGAHDEVAVDVRVLSATHQNLQELVSRNRFREDLYYRINVIGLEVPPLRERREDIPQLVEVILSRIAKRNHAQTHQIDPEVYASLNRYSFPGNIRELENILERATALCDNDTITSGDIGLDMNTAAGTQSPRDTPRDGETLDDYLFRREREIILDALDKHDFHITHTAEALGISFRSLRYKLKKHGIDKHIK